MFTHSVVLLCFLADFSISSLIVQTTTGKLQGKFKPQFGVNAFLGVPYAKQSRFKPPENYPSWSGIRDATKYGASCPQNIDEYPSEMIGQIFSEDCLFANVYVPSQATGASNLDVMVWIHGGSSRYGSGFFYDGSIYAGNYNVILVNINYRLGLLGFLSVPGTEVTGNYGLLDQVAALKWIQANIRSFGGNPDKVTIFGVSSAAACVSLLTLSPTSEGLVHRAIMASGSTAATWAVKKPTKEDFTKLASAIECPDEVDGFIQCIKGSPVNEVVAAQKKIEVGNIAGPVIDGTFLTQDPLVLLQSGKFHKIPTIMGASKNEGDMFLASLPVKDGMSRPIFEGFMKSYMKKEIKQVQDAILFEYSDNKCHFQDCPLHNRDIASSFISDKYFYAPLEEEARSRASNSSYPAVYVYLFSYNGSYVFPGMPEWIGVTHASDPGYVFGFPMLYPDKYSESDREVSRTIMKLWTSFANTGDPNDAKVVFDWPRFIIYGTQSNAYLNIDKESTVEYFYRSHMKEFWNTYITSLQGQHSDSAHAKVTSGCSWNVQNIQHMSIVVLLFISFLLNLY